MSTKLIGIDNPDDSGIEFRLQKIMDERKVDVKRLHAATGIPKSTLYSLLAGAALIPRPHHLVKLCRELNKNPGDFIQLVP